jgi:hypothetical protein
MLFRVTTSCLLPHLFKGAVITRKVERRYRSVQRAGYIRARAAGERVRKRGGVPGDGRGRNTPDPYSNYEEDEAYR